MSHAAERLLQQTVEHLRLKTGQLEDQVRLLERENEDLLQQLKDAGLQARRPVLHADRLPAPLAAADVAGVAEARRRMTPGERRLLDHAAGEGEFLAVYQSGTRVEVGLWVFERRVWVAVTARDVVLLAAGRRPLLQRVAFAHLYASLYNAMTGELVLAPDRGYRVGQVRLPPLEGCQVLAQIYGALAPRNEGSA